MVLANHVGQHRGAVEEPFAATDPAQLINGRQLAKLLGISQATFDRRRAGGQIPQPISFTPQCLRWRLREVRVWIDCDCPTATEWERIRVHA